MLSGSPSDWIKGITLSILATIIGGASKLAIRKSWLMEALDDDGNNDFNNFALVSQVGEDGDYSDERLSNGNRDSPSENALETRTQRTALCLRLSGMIGMTFLNPFCGVLAMNYASPSITAPFSGLTLVWIVIFSDVLIGEKPSCVQIGAAALIVFGEVVVAIFGDHTNDDGASLATLQQSYREPAFIIFLIGISCWMLLVLFWINCSTSESVKRFAWGVSGGSLTGIQNFLKDSLTVVKAHEGIPWYFPVWLMLAVVIAFGGLLFLSACMKRYDVTYSSSMFVGAYVVTASLMSIVHYHTFENLDKLVNYVLYPFGLLILISGVCILVIDTESKEATIEVNSVSAFS